MGVVATQLLILVHIVGQLAAAEGHERPKQTLVAMIRSPNTTPSPAAYMSHVQAERTNHTPPSNNRETPGLPMPKIRRRLPAAAPSDATAARAIHAVHRPSCQTAIRRDIWILAVDVVE